MLPGAWLAADTPVAAERTAGQSNTSAGNESSEGRQEESRYRFLPIPIVITEPAIGEGLGVALALFHPVKQGKLEAPAVATPESLIDGSESRGAPPVVTAVAGAYTNNDTWAVGLAHTNNWLQDSLRYAGALATARVNSQVYLANAPLRFSMDTTFIFQELKYRLGNSDFMLGGGLQWLEADTRFRLGLPGLPNDIDFLTDFTNIGLEGKLVYESRDNVMNPTAGNLGELNLWRFDRGLGGDFDYWLWQVKILAFHSFASKLTLGLRLDVSGVSGEPPFFAYPFVKLRGIPALRYQNQVAGAAEAEIRYRLAPRWEASVFGGLGYTNDSIRLFQNPSSIYNYGVGGRYQVFQAHNVWLGMDIARGPEDWNWYIQVGHPW